MIPVNHDLNPEDSGISIVNLAQNEAWRFPLCLVFFANEFAGVIDSVPTCLGKGSFPGAAGVIISEIGPFCQALWDE